LTFFLGIALLAVVPAGSAQAATPVRCSDQGSTLRLCNARTDNYKACYNQSNTDNRSWLAWNYVRAKGTNWKVVSGQSQFTTRITVQRTSAGSGGLPLRAFVRPNPLTSNIASTMIRYGDPLTLWGVLMQLGDGADIAAKAPQVRIVLRTFQGKELGRATATYKYDSAIANAPDGDPEHNGAGGRWWLWNHATPTDIELGSGATC
jgi:hypothetical protein